MRSQEPTEKCEINKRGLGKAASTASKITPPTPPLIPGPALTGLWCHPFAAVISVSTRGRSTLWNKPLTSLLSLTLSFFFHIPISQLLLLPPSFHFLALPSSSLHQWTDNISVSVIFALQQTQTKCGKIRPADTVLSSQNTDSLITLLFLQGRMKNSLNGQTQHIK